MNQPGQVDQNPTKALPGAAATKVVTTTTTKSVITTTQSNAKTTELANNLSTNTTQSNIYNTTSTLSISAKPSATSGLPTNNNSTITETNSTKEYLPTAVGYGVFGLLAIIAIIYIVKFSIDIDRENYRKQMMINNTNIQPTRKPTLNNNPQMNNNNVRLSPSVDNNTSFSSITLGGTMPYNTSMNSNQLAQPQGQATLSSPNSPNSTNQFNNNLGPTNNFQNGITYANRQSRQYLLQNY